MITRAAFSRKRRLAIIVGKETLSSFMADKKNRYVPSMSTLEKAAESLPDANHFRGETYQVPLESGRLIEFRKIRFKTREGKNARWIYDGKVIVL